MPDAAHRYTAQLAGEIESRWRREWSARRVYEAPNPVGSLAGDLSGFSPDDKLFVQDMFPYPSGAGLHVGHPLGFIASDVFARYSRMDGRNVLHTMGFDSFGLPAEQYAVQTGTHPRTTTEANIERYLEQIRRLGLGHDERRRVATTDVEFYRWTQWIFLQIYNSWFDDRQGKARPIGELIAEFDSGTRTLDDGREWGELDPSARRAIAAHEPDPTVPSFHNAEIEAAFLQARGFPVRAKTARQRRGHRRWPQRAGQLPGLPKELAAVDDADNRLL